MAPHVLVAKAPDVGEKGAEIFPHAILGVPYKVVVGRPTGPYSETFSSGPTLKTRPTLHRTYFAVDGKKLFARGNVCPPFEIL